MNVSRLSYMPLILAGGIVASVCSLAFAQTPTISATHKNVAYDDADAAQKLDVYLAKADHPMPTIIYIHGGGWRAGTKNRIPLWLSKAVREGWLSVVSVEYRFTNIAPHPAQVNDCVRAIQFVRHNAAKWNIDPQRLGVTGGSAGGHLTLWVALHDDAADADSKDPVEKHSSRVACAVSFAGPTDWSLLAQLEHKHPAYRQLLGYPPQCRWSRSSSFWARQYVRARATRWKKTTSLSQAPLNQQWSYRRCSLREHYVKSAEKS